MQYRPAVKKHRQYASSKEIYSRSREMLDILHLASPYLPAAHVGLMMRQSPVGWDISLCRISPTFYYIMLSFQRHYLISKRLFETKVPDIGLSVLPITMWTYYMKYYTYRRKNAYGVTSEILNVIFQTLKYSNPPNMVGKKLPPWPTERAVSSDKSVRYI